MFNDRVKKWKKLKKGLEMDYTIPEILYNQFRALINITRWMMCSKLLNDFFPHAFSQKSPEEQSEDLQHAFLFFSLL